jgi:hypothetical protein
MKYPLIFTAVIVLAGCGHNPVKPETLVAKEIEYVVRIPPKELLTIPPAVADIDVDAAKQGDIAKWILANEERMRALENMIKEIGLFFKVEDEKLKKQAEEKNKKEAEKTIQQQADSAAGAISKK